MKPTFLKTSHFLILLFALILTAGLISWDHKQASDRYDQTQTDTTPKKKTDREKKIRDLDEVIDELNEAELKLNMEKVQEEVTRAMKEFDAAKIKLEIEKAMKEVDFEKIRKEIETSIAKVDMSKIRAEWEKAIKEFDATKIEKEIRESMEKINWDKMKAEFEKVKEFDSRKFEEEMKKVEEELKNLGPKIEKELDHAKIEIEKAKSEMKEFKGFVDGLDNDGLINKKDAYTLKHKDGELIINGKKASEQVYNKYKGFLEQHKKFTIEKSGDDFNIDMD